MGRSVTDETVWEIDGGPSLSILEEDDMFWWTEKLQSRSADGEDGCLREVEGQGWAGSESDRSTRAGELW